MLAVLRAGTDVLSEGVGAPMRRERHLIRRRCVYFQAVCERMLAILRTGRHVLSEDVAMLAVLRAETDIL